MNQDIARILHDIITVDPSIQVKDRKNEIKLDKRFDKALVDMITNTDHAVSSSSST